MIIKKVQGFEQPAQRELAYSESELTDLYKDWVSKRTIPAKLKVVRLGQKETWLLEKCTTGRRLKEYANQLWRYLQGGFDNMLVHEVLEGKHEEVSKEKVLEKVVEEFLKITTKEKTLLSTPPTPTAPNTNASK